ncbi:hypothetical protein PR048_022639 [Dryococelus australis]|uniref:Uncharacterized protein n=1 Tax=Dryococelus australis TaxID=614101 RepID=A0ABQ9H1N2_9NEOP|nr:hypothetical protein PR048_022639 [Dryococelus australis]
MCEKSSGGLSIKCQHITTDPYYQFPNLVKRVNKNVKVALSIFHNHDHHSWDESISELYLAFNSVPHTTGFSPSKGFFGP